MHVKCLAVLMVLVYACLSHAAVAEDDLCGHVSYKSVEHKPRADVIYNPQPTFADDPIDIPITVDLADRYGINMPAGVELDVPVAFISVYKDGRILYDGKDISGNIKDECEHDSASQKQTEQPSEAKNGNQSNAGR